MVEPNQPPPPSPSLAPNTVPTNNSDRQHWKKKKKNFAPVGSGYIGKCEDIKLHVYDVRPTRTIDLFAKTM
jgi:hypothetical protein